MNLIIPKYKDIFQSIIPIFLIYLYMFQPPVFITKYVYISIEFLLLTVFVIIKDRSFVKILINKFKRELILIYLIISYVLIIDLLMGQEVYSFRFIAWFFQSFIFGFFIIRLFNFNLKKLFTTFYWTSVVAACISLILAFNPVLDLLYKAIQLDNVPIFDNMTSRHRVFGISENLTFTYSFVLGFFAGYTLTVLKKNILLIIPFFVLTLGVMYNARIGFLPIIVFIIYLVLRGDVKTFFNIFSLIIISVIILYSFFFEYIDVIFFNKKWALNFFYDISDTLFGTNYSSSSTIEILTGDFLIFPETLFSWVFGTGESLFVKNGLHSDVGYIIQLYYGGIILLGLIMLLMVQIFYRLIMTNGIFHWFTIVFCVSLFLLNFKGFVFAATPGGRMLFLFYMSVLLTNNKNNAIIKSIY